MTWGALFERAATFDVGRDDVMAAIERLDRGEDGEDA